MDISVFDVIGPVMIGPSSSHTAGAARLGRVARAIVAAPFTYVSIGLHGSFARTCRGHGTDWALVAGLLGLREDDERMSSAFSLAREQGLGFDFHEVELDQVHENAVQFCFTLADGGTSEVIGSSIGGGEIAINQIDGYVTDFSARNPTLVIFQHDRIGIVSRVARVLAANEINIGVMKVSRQAKGQTACCIIETDNAICEDVVAQIRSLTDILSVRDVQLDSGVDTHVSHDC